MSPPRSRKRWSFWGNNLCTPEPTVGKVAFIPFQPGTLANDTRTEGFKDVLGKNPQPDLVATQSSESDYNTALQVTNDILTAHPDLNAIYAANEPGVLGAA